jgi:hypothetical protein
MPVLVFALARPAVATAQTEAPRVPEETQLDLAPPPVGRDTAATPSPVVSDPSLVAAPRTDAPLPSAGAERRVPETGTGLTTVPIGISREPALLRSADGAVVIQPGVRLDLDGYAYRSVNPGAPAGALELRRARLEATGWLGDVTYFSLAVEASTPPHLATSTGSGQSRPRSIDAGDDFIAIAPWRELAILQVGQFDGPFTLENRTADAYLPFMERALAVRALGIPENKQVGAMVHGHDQDRHFLYSYGVFNGDGRVDLHLDSMGRGWIAPFSFAGSGPWHDVSVGASFWLGDRVNGPSLPAQTTQGGFELLGFEPYMATIAGAAMTPVQLRQVGLLRAVAAELNAPIGEGAVHRFGVRGELVWKHSPLSEESLANPQAPVILGGANLTGWSTYGELWFWALGDDRAGGDSQGLEPFKRRQRSGQAPGGPPGELPGEPQPFEDALMLALRVERLDEDLTHEADAAALGLPNPELGSTVVTSVHLGLTYWHARHLRASLNVGVNHLSGTNPRLASLADSTIAELGLRLGVVL